jgi:hypothetical protein
MSIQSPPEELVEASMRAVLRDGWQKEVRVALLESIVRSALREPAARLREAAARLREADRVIDQLRGPHPVVPPPVYKKRKKVT